MSETLHIMVGADGKPVWAVYSNPGHIAPETLHRIREGLSSWLADPSRGLLTCANVAVYRATDAQVAEPGTAVEPARPCAQDVSVGDTIR